MRSLIPFALIVMVAPLAAQEKPTPAAQQAVTGTWKFDQSRSDTVAGNPLEGMSGGSPMRGGGGGGGAGSGGGGGGGGGRRSRSTSTTALPDSTAKQPPVDAGPTLSRDPKMNFVLKDLNPGGGIILATNDSVVTIVMAITPDQPSTWKTDGKKRQEAQMDGTVIETQGMWKDGVLTLMRGVAGTASLKREFKPNKDGKTLEVKETLEVGTRKIDKKLIFTRP